MTGGAGAAVLALLCAPVILRTRRYAILNRVKDLPFPPSEMLQFARNEPQNAAYGANVSDPETAFRTASP